MKIPCNECLKYPTCKHRKQIVCDDFRTYFYDLYRSNQFQIMIKSRQSYLIQEEVNMAWEKAWEKVKDIFPNIGEITLKL